MKLNLVGWGKKEKKKEKALRAILSRNSREIFESSYNLFSQEKGKKIGRSTN